MGEKARKRIEKLEMSIFIIMTVILILAGLNIWFAIEKRRLERKISECLTYYTVDNRLNLTWSEDKIYSVDNRTIVCGSVTNIGNISIDRVYVYVTVKNADGTHDFHPNDYEALDNLYIGETMEFEVSVSFSIPLDKGQKIEILLLY